MGNGEVNEAERTQGDTPCANPEEERHVCAELCAIAMQAGIVLAILRGRLGWSEDYKEEDSFFGDRLRELQEQADRVYPRTAR